MKTFIVFCLLFISGYQLILSQNISFSAIDSKDGNPVVLDSVIIINKSFNVRKVIKNNFNTNLRNITDVTDPSIFTPQDIISNLVCDEGIINFNFQNNSNSNIKILAYDLNGNIEYDYNTFQSIGNYLISVPFSNLPQGVYLLKIQSNSNIINKLILNITNSANKKLHVEETEPIFTKINEPEIVNNGEYTFIGVAHKYFSDTINAIYPLDGTDFQFKLKLLSNWTVRRCSLNLSSLADVARIHSYKYGSGYETVNSRDSSKFTYKDKFINVKRPWFTATCDTDNINNKINISLCTYTGWGINSSFYAEVDTVNQCLRNVEYKYYEETNAGYYYIKKIASIQIPKINCTILNYYNITAKIEAADLKSIIFNYSNVSTASEMAGWYQTSYNYRSFLPDPDAYISIELTE